MEVAVGVDRLDLIALAESEADLRLFAGMQFLTLIALLGLAVSAGALESFSDGADNLLIGIELDFHVRHLFLDCGFIIPQDKVFFCDEVTLITKSGAFGAPDFVV